MWCCRSFQITAAAKYCTCSSIFRTSFGDLIQLLNMYDITCHFWHSVVHTQEERNRLPADRLQSPSVTLIKCMILLNLSVTQYDSLAVQSRTSQVSDIWTLSPPLRDIWSSTGVHWWNRDSNMHRKWTSNGSQYDSPFPPGYLKLSQKALQSSSLDEVDFLPVMQR